MSKQQLIDAIHSLEELSVLVQVEDDEHLADALEEIGVDDE